MVDGPNMHAYVRGNPASYVDPDGAWLLQAAAALVGAVVGVARGIRQGKNAGGILVEAAKGALTGAVSSIMMVGGINVVARLALQAGRVGAIAYQAGWLGSALGGGLGAGSGSVIGHVAGEATFGWLPGQSFNVTGASVQRAFWPAAAMGFAGGWVVGWAGGWPGPNEHLAELTEFLFGLDFQLYVELAQAGLEECP